MDHQGLVVESFLVLVVNSFFLLQESLVGVGVSEFFFFPKKKKIFFFLFLEKKKGMNATAVLVYTTLCEHDDAVFLLLMLAGVIVAMCHSTAPTRLATTKPGV